MERAELVGLVAHLKKLPGEVSGGMRKRAGLARALMLDPEIVFFDEPDSGLDPVRVAHLDRLVKVVQAETGSTFFIISHNIESIKRTADNMGLLFRSGLVAFGPAQQMLQSTDPIISQFLRGVPEGPIGMDEMADQNSPQPLQERTGPPHPEAEPADETDPLFDDLAPQQLGHQRSAGSS
jgi:phospholipid/cholesterol/gamma-HCH transport system ATP-binding protein